MSLVRTVLPECLDSLSPLDPAAVRARNDLRRVHRVMGTKSILLAALRPWAHADRAAPLRVLELGAGDGQLLLGVARALGPAWAPVELTLLDRQFLLDPATRAAYAALGWSAREQVCDVHDWAADIGRSAPVRLPPAHGRTAARYGPRAR